MFSKKIVGLDIADNTIEAVYLKGNSLHTKILGLARVNIESGIVEKGRIKDEEKLATVLKKLFSKAKPKSISNRNIIFGFPDAVTYINVFDLPPHAKKDRKNLVREEVVSSVPEKIDNLVYSYRVLKQNKAGAEVLVIAVNREIFYEWIRFFKKNKFEIQTFDVEAMALFRDLYSNLPKEPVCVVDIGAETTKINIFDKAGLHFNYSVMVAGEDMTKDLAVDLKLKNVEAEDIKKKNGLTGKNKKISKILGKRVEEILKEIFASINYFENKTSNKVAEVMLVGGSSLLPGLIEYLQEKLELPIKLGRSRILEKKVSLEYIEAVGLALRGLNKSWDKKDPEIIWDNKMKKKKIEKKVVEVDGPKENNLKDEEGLVVEEKSDKQPTKIKFLLIILVEVMLLLAGVIWFQNNQKVKLDEIVSKTSEIAPEAITAGEETLGENADTFFIEDSNLLTTTSSVTNTEVGF